MKTIPIILILCILYCSSSGQTRGGVLSQEESKKITEYYCKQYIVDEVLKIPDRQSIEVYIDAITASTSGEITTVLYKCSSLKKKGVVLAFWNDYIDILLPYKGFGFCNLEIEKANILFNDLEALMNQENLILANITGNKVFKSDNITLLFSNSGSFLGKRTIRVWFDKFDSDWNQANLKTTIRRFRKFFNLTK